MEEKVKQEIFKMFQNEKDVYKLYENILNYIAELINDVKGNENAKFYETLRILSNSINNAGWEERHSSQIDIVEKESRNISQKYERFLP